MRKKIWFVATSHDQKGNTGESTGFYLSEVSHPWDELVKAGYEIDFVSPKGGKAPITGFDLNDPVNKKSGEDKRYRSKTDESVAVLTRYEVKKEYRNLFRKAIRRYVKRARARETNIMAEAYREQDHSSVLWVVERWSSQSDFNRMRAGSRYKLLQLLAGKKLNQPTREIAIKDLEPVSKSDWRRVPEKQDKPITIMLFVDSQPGTEANFKAVYHTAMPQFRAEPGVINYQLSQVEGDNARFVTYEKFRNEEAFQYHLNFPPIQPVIDYLNTSIKQQPFQTGLHRLIEFAPMKRK
ncbi:antibiotic biosynthesis monooxygenase [Larkinella terrae]|nr:antibiotic biosynthesis monooxygenase [Larkinella terrae]